MTTAHKDISNAYLHEAKGASAATTGQILKASGGVNSWEWDRFMLVAELDDISTASSTYVAVPWAFQVDEIYSVIHGTIATANDTLTCKINGTAITSGALTVAYSGSAAGDVDSATPSAANTGTAGSYLEVATDGASTNTVRATITFLCTRTA